ncbi:MAG: LLM class F420-dependent oxidoreductase [Novosphingobium sp.]
MKLAINIGYNLGARLELPINIIKRAEELGFDSVWSAETYGSDAFSPLAYIAAHTRSIRLCTGIAQLAARTPANCAMIAQTIEELAGRGRIVVGLGLSGPQIVEGWYGQPWGKPADRIRDYVAIMREVWRREAPVSHDGPEISLPYTGEGSTGLGKPLKSILHGNPAIPVWLGTSTPGHIRLTAEIADGWLSMHFSPAGIAAGLKHIEQGLARRDDERSLRDFEIAANLRLTVTDDVRGALDEQKPAIALYVGGMGARGKNFHKDAMAQQGFADAAERIQELFLAGHKAEAAAAVPDDYVDDASLVGPEPRIRERFQRWRESGATMLRLANPDIASVEVLSRIARQV